MKLTKEAAKELCILKWEYIVNNNGKSDGLLNIYPELKNMNACCPYCELYVSKNCETCPINLDIIDDKFGCNAMGHPYRQWTYNPSKTNAQTVLDLIIKSE